jgi:hypothetical protein
MLAGNQEPGTKGLPTLTSSLTMSSPNDSYRLAQQWQELTKHKSWQKYNYQTCPKWKWASDLKPLRSSNTSFGSTLYRRYPSQDKRISELLSTCSGRHAPLLLPSATVASLLCQKGRQTTDRFLLLDIKKPPSTSCSSMQLQKERDLRSAGIYSQNPRNSKIKRGNH